MRPRSRGDRKARRRPCGGTAGAGHAAAQPKAARRPDLPRSSSPVDGEPHYDGPPSPGSLRACDRSSVGRDVGGPRWSGAESSGAAIERGAPPPMRIGRFRGRTLKRTPMVLRGTPGGFRAHFILLARSLRPGTCGRLRCQVLLTAHAASVRGPQGRERRAWVCGTAGCPAGVPETRPRRPPRHSQAPLSMRYRGKPQNRMGGRRGGE